MKKFCFALDLVDDPAFIAEYEEWHRHGMPENLEAIRRSGITNMEIYRVGNRMFMIMETTDEFSFEAKAASDRANPKVQEWEGMMWKYQQSLPFAANGEKWMLMTKIFQL